MHELADGRFTRKEQSLRHRLSLLVQAECWRQFGVHTVGHNEPVH